MITDSPFTICPSLQGNRFGIIAGFTTGPTVMTDTVAEMNQVMAEADCLVDEQQVSAAIDTMASAITDRLKDSNPLLFCVMNGGLITTGQLLPRLKFPVQAEYLHATRYRQETTGGILEWKLQPESDMKDRTVLIVDDILDEGTTLCAIADYCLAHGAREVLTAVLVDKIHERKARPGLKADFTGLYVEDRFLFGYGMDYKGYWRNAPGIYAVKGL
jgi:hypoxanthine phosphoribosyltransferase